MKKTDEEEFIVPDWVPKQAWEEYLKMRKRIKRPITEYAKSLAVKKLERLVKEGYSAEDVLNESTLRCWTGIFGESNRFNSHKNGHDWKKSHEGIERKGRDLGIPPRQNESYSAYADRLEQAERTKH